MELKPACRTLSVKKLFTLALISSSAQVLSCMPAWLMYDRVVTFRTERGMFGCCSLDKLRRTSCARSSVGFRPVD
ncbi:hypothetical protein ILYODFUR_005828 [Ilyodon furcidens]|uniref:Secreted protein n=2 Tax=Goodeidae TaxID=28758 RepID=A0ABV0VEP0_9TELE